MRRRSKNALLDFGKHCKYYYLCRADCHSGGNYSKHGEKQEKRKIILRMRVLDLPAEQLLPYKKIIPLRSEP